MLQVSPESVTLDTLQLLQDTVDYLKRLPLVPVTYALCKKIEAHLADPSVVTIKRRALEKELLEVTRIARRYGPTGAVMAEVIVTADTVTYRFPEILAMKMLESLRTGETLPFSKKVS